MYGYFTIDHYGKHTYGHEWFIYWWCCGLQLRDCDHKLQVGRKLDLLGSSKLLSCGCVIVVVWFYCGIVR